MRNRMWSILALVMVASMVLAACGATPTATPVPPTATTVAPTKAPAAAPTNTAAPAAAAATATTAPAAATATKAPAAAATTAPAAGTATPVPPPAPAASAKTMVIGAGTMPPNLNPFNIPGGQWQRFFRYTLVRLINLDENNKLVSDLADTWTISPDGKEFVFNLRKDVTWSDGSKLTSKDVHDDLPAALRQGHRLQQFLHPEGGRGLPGRL